MENKEPPANKWREWGTGFQPVTGPIENRSCVDLKCYFPPSVSENHASPGQRSGNRDVLVLSAGEKRITTLIVQFAVVLLSTASTVRADLFTDYALLGAFTVPSDTYAFDVLPDGRIVTVSSANVFVESTLLSRTFVDLGPLPAADFSAFGAAFVRVSPDGTRIAVGNNGGSTFANYQVGVFALPALTGTWFNANHFDAEWFDDTRLALTTGGAAVTLLDVDSPNPTAPTNPVVVANIGGASAGVTFDDDGNLYTGDGFSASDTGLVKAFAPSEWTPALAGGSPADFQNDGVVIVDILSAASLGFDAEGNLHVSGGDFVGGMDVDFAALVNGINVLAALSGGGAVDVDDPLQVRRLDPDTTSGFNFYAINHNRVTGELYVQDFGSTTVYVYSAGAPVPAASTWGLIILGGLLLTVGSILARPRTV